MARVDSDLVGLWVYYPRGAPGATVTGGIDASDYRGLYGPAPYVFRAVRQNGSRVHLLLQVWSERDGSYQDATCHGQPCERRAYASDLRHGVYWRRG